MPVAHQLYDYAQKSAAQAKGEKIFYMKARIVAGQVDLDANQLGLTDFRWVTKEELQELLRPRDFAAIRNILAAR